MDFHGRTLSGGSNKGGAFATGKLPTSVAGDAAQILLPFRGEITGVFLAKSGFSARGNGAVRRERTLQCK